MGYGSNEFNVQSPTLIASLVLYGGSLSRFMHVAAVGSRDVALQVVYLKGKL
jgi:hypothetical protein